MPSAREAGRSSRMENTCLILNRKNKDILDTTFLLCVFGLMTLILFLVSGCEMDSPNLDGPNYDSAGGEESAISVNTTQFAFLEDTQPDPGGVGGSVLWLKANTGTSTSTEGQSLTAWADQSENGYVGIASGVDGETAPTFRDNSTDNINFNSVISFDGAGNGISFGSDYIFSKNNGMEILVVLTSRETGSKKFVFDFGLYQSGGYGLAYSQNLVSAYTPTDHGGISLEMGNGDGPTALVGSRIKFGDTQQIFQNGRNIIVGAIPSLTQISSSEIYEYPVHTNVGNSVPVGGPVTIGRISKPLWDLDRSFNGNIAEVIVFDDALSEEEYLQVESYLAMKYGITLHQKTGQDYVASDGVTLMWDSNAPEAFTFDNDIAGIGQDDDSGLVQTKSRSIAPDSLVIIGAASDQQNMEFLTWANDDGPISYTNDNTPEERARLTRIWQVQKEGDVGTVSVQFDLTGMGFDAALAGNMFLFVDSDTDFSDGTAMVATSFTGNVVTFAGVDFSTEDYFTLGMLDWNEDTIPDELSPDCDDDGIPNALEDLDNDGDLSNDDTDNDGIPNYFDSDCDGDGIEDGVDNCPLVINGYQVDSNNDGVGDVCCEDEDGDGIPDEQDNCPDVANRDQTDSDDDGMGDACSEDNNSSPSWTEDEDIIPAFGCSVSGGTGGAPWPVLMMLLWLALKRSRDLGKRSSSASEKRRA